jgi:hypothetical protein
LALDASELLLYVPDDPENLSQPVLQLR